MSGGPLWVHWIRHGEVASHRGDVPVTPGGLAAARTRGSQLAAAVAPGEVVHFLHTATRRTLETAAALREGMAAVLAARGLAAELRAPAPEPAIRNPDLYVAGLRVEMVSTPEALAEQTAAAGLGPDALRALPFWPAFWAAPDRIGFWVDHPDPPGEDAAGVARRLLTWAFSLRGLPAGPARRFICITHSGPMRAFLRAYLLGHDPGEPEYSERIDLCLPGAGPATVTFRGRRAALPEGETARREPG